MAILIRVGYNNSGWCNRCTQANIDRRLFKCKDTLDTGYRIDRKGNCQAPSCWEAQLCKHFKWFLSSGGKFGSRAKGRAYFIYPDVDGSVVLFAKSKIIKSFDSTLLFKKFIPLSPNHIVKGITYADLNRLGVPPFGSGTFRYIEDEVADRLDNMIATSDNRFEDDSELFMSTEGKKILRTHLERERSSRLVALFKASLKHYGCCICEFDFSKKYGALGSGFIEAHHNKPVASYVTSSPVSISDLSPVCSNCHRMLHKKYPSYSIKKMKMILQ